MKFLKNLIFILLILITVTAMYSCKKNTTNTTVTPILDCSSIIKNETGTTNTTSGTGDNNSNLVMSSIQYYQYFDTYITIQVWDTKKHETDDQFWKGMEHVIQTIQCTFKRNAPAEGEEESELYLLNQSAGKGQPYHVSDDLYEVIKVGLKFAEETNGKLDPAIGPLVDLWDIHDPEHSHPAPGNDDIAKLLPLIDYNLIETNDANKTVYLPKAGMVIDLGAISKGFAADKIAQYLQNNNIGHAIINLGGNVFAYGSRTVQRDDGTYNWAIGIQDPREEQLSTSIGTLYLQNKTVVTSGIYERYIIDPNTNKLYHHILDPDTGYPVDNNLASVSIITESSTTADALSTSIFALGLTDGMNFIENYNGDVEAIFITKDNKVYLSSGVITKYHFEITDKDFIIETLHS